MKFPKADQKTKEYFLSVLPDDPQLQIRPMFGHLAAFVNGNMFASFFGSDIIVRLPAEEREGLVKEEGASPFEPMGRAMKEYIVLPGHLRNDPARVRALLLRSLKWAAGLKPKAKGKPGR